MDQHHVDQPEVHGVIMYGKTTIGFLQNLQLLQLTVINIRIDKYHYNQQIIKDFILDIEIMNYGMIDMMEVN